jgi:hypothetical protein
MATQRKTAAPKSVRQSVTTPASVVGGVRRTAEERLEARCNRFLAETDPVLKSDAGKELIRAIFGTEAVGEDLAR